MNLVQARFVSTQTAAEAQGAPLFRFPLSRPPVLLFPSDRGRRFVDYSIGLFKDVAILMPEFIPILVREELVLIDEAPDSSYAERVSSLSIDLNAFDRQIDEPCILLGGWTVWYHWLLNFLPRLYVVELARQQMPGLGDRKVAVPSDVLQRPAYVSTLAALGVPREKIIDMGSGPIVRFSDLAIPNIFPTCLLCPSAIAFMSEAFGAFAGASGGLLSQTAPRRRVYISRDRGAPMTRRIRNHSAVDSVFRYFGFDVCYMEAYSFEEQVRLISQAECVAGTHGSGLTNLIFAPPGGAFLEIGGFARSMFSDVADVVGLRDHVLVVSNEDEIFQRPVHIDDEHAHWGDYVVDTDALVAMLEKMGLEPREPLGVVAGAV